ncbi:MAG TPA: hypothetical protein PK170_07820 [Anaerolineae bacterium]|nr:hypothetical protein [Anaerolineae bacterium]
MTIDNPPPQLQLTQIKGSWEDRVAQVERLLNDDAPTALEQSQTLIDRLCRIPVVQRKAANDRLNDLLISAAMNQARHLAGQENYVAAAATLSRVAPYMPAVIAHDLKIQALNYLLCDGQTNTALSELEALAVSGGAIDFWSDLVWAGIRCNDHAYAQRGLAGAERWVNHTYQGAFDTDAAQRDLALLASLKARYTLACGQYAEAVAWYEHAMTLDEPYSSNPSLLYRHLVNAGAYAEASRLLQRDLDSPIRHGFWNGLLEYRKGHLERAASHWLKVTQHETGAGAESRLFEYILSHYYLGDKSGRGLARVLDTLSGGEVTWGALFLAGLGWALRGDMTAAVKNMQMATREIRSDGQSRRLPAETWRFCRDLLEADRLESIKEFFEHATL